MVLVLHVAGKWRHHSVATAVLVIFRLIQIDFIDEVALRNFIKDSGSELIGVRNNDSREVDLL